MLEISLIDALREEFTQPTIGIMEASLYTARMLGARFGIVATAARSKFMQEDAGKVFVNMLLRSQGVSGLATCCSLHLLSCS